LVRANRSFVVHTLRLRSQDGARGRPLRGRQRKQWKEDESEAAPGINLPKPKTLEDEKEEEGGLWRCITERKLMILCGQKLKMRCAHMPDAATELSKLKAMSKLIAIYQECYITSIFVLDFIHRIFLKKSLKVLNP
jgi:hypothetical protein